MVTAPQLVELIGYAGSLLVLVSFLMTSVFRLRVVNMIGSVIFMIYALIIRSYPTALMNFCLVLINLHFLWKMSHQEKHYELIEVGKDDAFLQYELQRYGEDIRKCFPGVEMHSEETTHRFVFCCQGVPVGLFLGKRQGDEMEIFLDYFTPEYRDFSLGKFLMKKLGDTGVKTLLYRGPDAHHKAYLQKMAFQKTNDGYRKDLI